MPAADASNPIEAVRARLDGGTRWHQGALSDGAGRYCVRGAFKAANVSTALTGPYQLLRRVVTEQFPDRTEIVTGDGLRSVPMFNDHPDTTWADVDLVLDKASVAWDEQVRP